MCVCVRVCVRARAHMSALDLHYGNQYTIYISLTSKCFHFSTYLYTYHYTIHTSMHMKPLHYIHISNQQFFSFSSYLQRILCLYLSTTILHFRGGRAGGRAGGRGPPSVTAATALRSMLMPSLPIGNSTEFIFLKHSIFTLHAHAN